MHTSQVAEKPVILYTTPFCPYCHAAKRLLDEQEIPYESVDLAGQKNFREFLYQKTGRRTVPQILVNGTPIGGYTNLLALSQQGKLDDLLAKGGSNT